MKSDDIKRGMKRKELDEISRNGVMAIGLFLGVIIGVVARNFWVGFGIFLVISIYAVRKYYEL